MISKRYSKHVLTSVICCALSLGLASCVNEDDNKHNVSNNNSLQVLNIYNESDTFDKPLLADGRPSNIPEANDEPVTVSDTESLPEYDVLEFTSEMPQEEGVQQATPEVQEVQHGISPDDNTIEPDFTN